MAAPHLAPLPAANPCAMLQSSAAAERPRGPMNQESRQAAAVEKAETHRAPAPPLDHAAVRSIIIGIMLAMFLSALEQTIVAPALPTIGRSLADMENLSWVVTAYLLAATVATPLFGKLSDIYGRRAVLLISVPILLAGPRACASAPSR